jgi:hypothetical protein
MSQIRRRRLSEVMGDEVLSGAREHPTSAA